LWLFVLFPMLADRHPRIRRTTDAALATRVLHRGDEKRTAKNGSIVHDSYADWDQAEDWMGDEPDVDLDDAYDQEDSRSRSNIESVYFTDEFVPDRRGRGGFDPEADAIASANRYAFRQRMVLGLTLSVIVTGALGVVLTPGLLWASGTTAIGLVSFLGYLRRQVRLEEEIRRRRAARFAQADREHGATGRAAVYDDEQAEYEDDDYDDVAPSRRVVLEADDEDPIFDHLDYYEYVEVDHDDQTEHQHHHFRRAVGE